MTSDVCHREIGDNLLTCMYLSGTVIMRLTIGKAAISLAFVHLSVCLSVHSSVCPSVRHVHSKYLENPKA